jgi:hypothetical protein
MCWFRGTIEYSLVNNSFIRYKKRCLIIKGHRSLLSALVEIEGNCRVPHMEVYQQQKTSALFMTLSGFHLGIRHLDYSYTSFPMRYSV